MIATSDSRELTGNGDTPPVIREAEGTGSIFSGGLIPPTDTDLLPGSSLGASRGQGLDPVVGLDSW